MREVVQAVLGLVIFSAVVGACLWLRQQKHKVKVEKFPFWRLTFLVFTYGGALWMFVITLAFGQWSGIAPKRSALGDVLQIIGDTLGIYLFVLAPVGILLVGVITAVQRGNFIYQRIVYSGCAGYALFLLAFFILAASRCNIPPGGIP